MGLPNLKTKVNIADHFAGRGFSPVRHEYIDGEVRPIAAASRSQNRMNFEVHRRNGGWLTYYFNERSEVIELTSVDLLIPLPDLYRRVQLPRYARRDD